MNNRNSQVDASKYLLISAAQNGDITQLKSLLEAKVDIDTLLESGESALICAAKMGHLTCVEALVKEGAKLDIQDHTGCSALMWAVGNIKLDCVKMLIEAKANLNLQDENKDTALTVASIASTRLCYDAAGMLLEAGADLHIKMKDDFAALDVALDHECRVPEMISLLLSYGAVTTQPDKLDNFLRQQDQAKMETYACMSLFCQQQETLREEKCTDSTLLLSDKAYTALITHLEAMSQPQQSIKPLREIVVSQMDACTNRYFPLELVKLTSQYDNPYQRLGIFKYTGQSNKADDKTTAPVVLSL